MAYKWSKKLSDSVVREYGAICHLCGEQINLQDVENGLSVDHVIPRSKGGTDSLENLRPSHKRCNFRRQDLDMSVWRAQTTDEISWWRGLPA